MPSMTGHQVLEPCTGKMGLSPDSFTSQIKQVLLLPNKGDGYTL